MHAAHDLLQQQKARNALVLRVVIREQQADVAETGCAEQGVHQSVREHVRIGVTVQPALERNFHAAEDELAPRNEAVYIISVSDPHVVLPFQIASAMRRSTGVVIFKFLTSPGRQAHRPSRPPPWRSSRP